MAIHFRTTRTAQQLGRLLPRALGDERRHEANEHLHAGTHRALFKLREVVLHQELRQLMDARAWAACA